MMWPLPPGDFRIKRLLSRLASSGGEGKDVGDGYGLVKKEGQLFVWIVRGRELMVSEGGGSCLVEVKIGDCKKRTRHGDGKVAIPAWEELVSFSRAQTQQSAGCIQPIEVSVKQAERQLGRVVIDQTQVPICLPSRTALPVLAPVEGGRWRVGERGDLACCLVGFGGRGARPSRRRWGASTSSRSSGTSESPSERPKTSGGPAEVG